MQTPNTETPVFPFANSSANHVDEIYTRLRTENPVSRVVLSGVPVWLVTRNEDVRFVLSDNRFSLARSLDEDIPRLGTFAPQPGSILASDPPEHTRIRKLAAKAFTVRRIERLRPYVRQTSEELLDRLTRHGSPADLVENFAAPLPIKIICTILGVPEKDQSKFRDWTEKIASVTGTPLEEVQAGWEQLQDYTTDLVNEKRRNPTDDLLSALVSARDEDDKLSEQELVQFGLTLLAAGHETTKNQLANSVLVLLRHYPEQWRRLRENPELIPGAVEELLRYVPLFGFDVTFPRVALEEVVLNGVTVREGDTVLVALSSANRDGDVFDAPDTLDVERVDNHHLAFGSGVHRCLGAQLAKIELEVGLEGLLRRFPHMETALDGEEPRWKPGSFIRSLRELPVRWGTT
ncbi:nocardicin N-oxygenase [Actinopolyspora xinjiangensis]|uniref:Nocardicin N-oxygenase n=1 Tax=Actinopolyspora xinjiangensis TaxID=405564 RepID=A0A1H0RSL4_9ACTN|nr:cytochrome P450 [Actinopolyspora xinjiangensis]SDP31936.1 nocardicin N-oxygenase [Actinopolyspora xinjiangensis]